MMGVLGLCVEKVEAGEWELGKLCTTAEKRMAFGPFVGAGNDSDSYASGGNSQVGLANDENTALAEFVGSSLLAFSTALSRLHPLNSIEGAAAPAAATTAGGGGLNMAAAGGSPSHASERHTLSLFRQLAGLLLRLLRTTYPSLLLLAPTQKPAAVGVTEEARVAQGAWRGRSGEEEESRRRRRPRARERMRGRDFFV